MGFDWPRMLSLGVFLTTTFLATGQPPVPTDNETPYGLFTAQDGEIAIDRVTGPGAQPLVPRPWGREDDRILTLPPDRSGLLLSRRQGPEPPRQRASRRLLRVGLRSRRY